ncbi:hypothetical protein CMI42_03520, partial [Candidatus Pacearchaeota archaeon]|nr:hypothetical protein [Candidatus Pacearchaeota archaeon]
MDKNIPIILVGLVVTAILFWIVAFGVGAFPDNENDDEGKNYFGDKSEFGNHRMKEGYVLGCYGEEIPQIRGEGKEHKIVNLNKRCYKEVFS